MAKDYYQLLGVTKTATDDEIKKAFRKMAHQYHPDKSSGDEAKFKEINEAYQVLSNKQKRQQYDQFGTTFENAQRQGGFGGGQGFNGNFGDFASAFRNASGDGQNIHFDFGDMGDLGDLFGDLFGMGGGRSRTRRGAHLQVDILIPFREAVFGTEKTFNINGKKVAIKIPAGIDNGQSIRLSGQGQPAATQGGQPGDLFVRVQVAPDSKFQRQGSDIVTRQEINFTQAGLGAKIDIETLDGLVKLKIPEGTQSGKVFRIRGKGVPKLNGRGRGDHLIQVIVITPTRLSRKQKKLLEELGQ